MTDANLKMQTADEVAHAMRLRPSAPKVMRLSRKALMIGGGMLSVLGGGLLILALRQSGSGHSVEPELYRPAETTPEQVRMLPDTYSGPRLGPPLPGDLGRAMLQNQRQDEANIATDPQASLAAATPSSPNPAETARLQALARDLQMQEAAVTSALFVGVSNSAAAPATAGPAMADTPPLSPPMPVQAGAAATLWPGTVISAGLITGLRSDLPGAALGQVLEDVLDSRTGETVVIPRGARLIGAYDAQVGQGQSRLKVVWNSLILPDGRRVRLGDVAASDAHGYAGLQDGVDDRWRERWRAAGLTTLLSVSAAATDGGDDDRLVRSLREGVGSGVDQIGRDVLAQGLSLPPRLTVRPGHLFSIILTEPLSIEAAGD